MAVFSWDSGHCLFFAMMHACKTQAGILCILQEITRSVSVCVNCNRQPRGNCKCCVPACFFFSKRRGTNTSTLSFSAFRKTFGVQPVETASVISGGSSAVARVFVVSETHSFCDFVQISRPLSLPRRGGAGQKQHRRSPEPVCPAPGSNVERHHHTS